ncbi:MAG: methionyl-tRNA formyltransferase [Candidatus Falkowbacteria bacterium]
MKPLKIIFAGTPDYAATVLQALLRDTDFLVQAVITQPDMPAGRGLEVRESAVKKLAKQVGLTIWQPQKVSQIIDQIRELEPDFLVVAAFAQLVPESILKIPALGPINVHGSLLPRYRGAGVIQAPILNGDSQTGITIMLMDKGLDTGPILAQQAIAIAPDETGESLYDKLADAGARLLSPTLKALAQGQIKPQAQDNTKANYVGLVKKEDGLIDWTKPASDIERLVRAMYSWPGAWTWLKGKQIKITAVDPIVLPLNVHQPGKTFIYNNQLAIQCGTDALVIQRLKMEGKGEISGKEFINGHRQQIGQILGQ